MPATRLSGQRWQQTDGCIRLGVILALLVNGPHLDHVLAAGILAQIETLENARYCAHLAQQARNSEVTILRFRRSGVLSDIFLADGTFRDAEH